MCAAPAPGVDNRDVGECSALRWDRERLRWAHGKQDRDHQRDQQDSDREHTSENDAQHSSSKEMGTDGARDDAKANEAPPVRSRLYPGAGSGWVPVFIGVSGDVVDPSTGLHVLSGL